MIVDPSAGAVITGTVVFAVSTVKLTRLLGAESLPAASVATARRDVRALGQRVETSDQAPVPSAVAVPHGAAVDA